MKRLFMSKTNKAYDVFYNVKEIYDLNEKFEYYKGDRFNKSERNGRNFGQTWWSRSVFYGDKK